MRKIRNVRPDDGLVADDVFTGGHEQFMSYRLYSEVYMFTRSVLPAVACGMYVVRCYLCGQRTNALSICRVICVCYFYTRLCICCMIVGSVMLM